ncbi:co-chaperone DjlA [Pseudomonadota bacterium]
MAWWGKLVGGAFGFMLGGPLGAALGAVLGHKFDTGLGKLDGVVRIEIPKVGDQQRVQTAFFTATFSVMGYMAKVDGHVSPSEIAMAENIIGHMQLSRAQRGAAIKLFNLGKTPEFALDDVLEQFRLECHHRTTLLQMFLEIQVQAALADGRIDATEKTLLEKMANSLHFAPGFIDDLLQFVRGAGSVDRREVPRLDDAYKVLGVDSSASYAEVKRSYRRLMNQHHPDKLVAKGLPDEMLKMATEKTQQIQKAYDRISDSRKQK